MINPNTLKPFGKFCVTIGMLPTSYKESLTYEEQLIWFCNYLETKVIPAVNNNAEALKEVQALYEELRQFIVDYFAHLDVQDEIDNKLDEMAESGQLIEIISEYLNMSALLCFNNISDLKNATNLINGSFVKTLGFHNINDYGGNIYKIRNKTLEDSIDEISIISLNDNSLIAELIEMPEMYVNQYGAYGDGIHNDTSSIQYAISHHLFGSIYFANGTYIISSPIKTYIDNNKQSNIIMQKTTTIKTNENIDCLFELGGLGGSNEGVENRLRTFKGGILDATNCESAIKINSQAMGILIEGSEFKNFTTYGIYIPSSANLFSGNIIIKDCYINGLGSQLNNYGLYLNRPDNKIYNTNINGTKIGIYCGQGGQIINGVHALTIFSNNFSDNEFQATKFIQIEQGDIIIIDNCYCDSFCTFIESSSSDSFILTNSAYYSYINNVDCKLFILNNQNCKYNIVNNNLVMPTPSTYHKGIIYSQFNDQISLRNGLINIKNNIIENFDKFISGDLLCQLNDSYTPYWLNTNITIKSDSWLPLGYLIAGVPWQELRLDIEGYEFILNFKLERINDITYLTDKPSYKTYDNSSFNLGFKYVHSNNGYDVYEIFIKQLEGPALKTDINISALNKNIPFIPYKLNLIDTSFVSENMDAVYSF